MTRNVVSSGSNLAHVKLAAVVLGDSVEFIVDDYKPKSLIFTEAISQIYRPIKQLQVSFQLYDRFCEPKKESILSREKEYSRFLLDKTVLGNVWLKVCSSKQIAFSGIRRLT